MEEIHTHLRGPRQWIVVTSLKEQQPAKIKCLYFCTNRTVNWTQCGRISRKSDGCKWKKTTFNEGYCCTARLGALQTQIFLFSTFFNCKSVKKPQGVSSENDTGRLSNPKIFARRKDFSQTTVCEAHRVYDWNFSQSINQSINQNPSTSFPSNAMLVRLVLLLIIRCLVQVLSCAVSSLGLHPSCEPQQQSWSSSLKPFPSFDWLIDWLKMSFCCRKIILPKGFSLKFGECGKEISVRMYECVCRWIISLLELLWNKQVKPPLFYLSQIHRDMVAVLN